MTEFQFFTNSIFNDLSVIKKFDDLTAQNNYFNSLEKKTVSGAYKGMSEPFLLFEAIEDAIAYSYGRFKIGEKWYYFTVTDVQQDTAGKTWVYWRLDAWQTAKYQYNISLGRGYITRSSAVEPSATPYDCKYQKVDKFRSFFTRYDVGEIGNLGYPIDVVFFYRNHEDNTNRIGYIQAGVYSSGAYFSAEQILALSDGTWSTILGFEPADIIGAWFSPALFSISDKVVSGNAKGWKKLELPEGNIFRDSVMVTLTKSEIPTGTPFIDPWPDLIGAFSSNILEGFKTDETHTAVIKDLEGNIVYQLDFNRDYTKKLYYRLNVTPTSAKWEFYEYKTDEGTIYENFNTNGNVLFTLPCSGLDYFVDSYEEYFARDRDFDIATRELNNKKDLVSGVSSGAANAISGAATGALLGSVVPGIGTAIGGLLGGLAGAIGGAITSGASAGVNAYYNPQEQAIKDSYYKKAVDPLAITGSNLYVFASEGSGHYGVTQYVVDDDTKARIEDDIAAFGHYTTRATDDGESYIVVGAKLKGEFVVKGDIPESWKAQIQALFASGVQIV